MPDDEGQPEVGVDVGQVLPPLLYEMTGTLEYLSEQIRILQANVELLMAVAQCQVPVLRKDVDLLLRSVNRFHDYPPGAVRPQTFA